MRLSLLFALSVAAFLATGSAQLFKKDDDEDELGPICKALLTVTEAVCQDINLPVGVDVTWCQNEDRCIHKSDICEPKYPCKWAWKTKKINICDALKIDDKFIEGQKKLCGCWKDIYNYRLNKIGSAFKEGSLQGAVSSALSTGVEGMVCVAQTCDIPPFNGKVCLRDNQEKKEQYIENQGKTQSIIELPEIGIELYLDFVTRIGTCATTGACGLLKERFKKYLQDSQAAVISGIKDYGIRVLKVMGGPIAKASTALDIAKNFMNDIKEDGPKCDVEGVSYNELQSSWQNIEQLRDMLTKTKDALNFENGIKQIQNLFGSDDDKVLGINIKALQAMIDIPATITAILETADVMSDIIPILPKIPKLFDEFQKFASNDMKLAIKKYASNLNDPACSKVHNVLTKYSNDIEKALDESNKLNFQKVFETLKDSSKIKFVPGVETFDHWLSFKLRAPKFVWREYCPFHFINHNSTLACITVPIFKWSNREVANRKLIPGFLPYLTITFPFDK